MGMGGNGNGNDSMGVGREYEQESHPRTPLDYTSSQTSYLLLASSLVLPFRSTIYSMPIK